MRSGNKARKTHQTWWNDLKPWVEQLYEDHRVYVTFTVHLFADVHQMKPTLEMDAYRVLKNRTQETVRNEVTAILTEEQGHTEAMALRLVSRLLLDLENEKESAQRQAPLWPATPA